ncbi:hypothetical protein L3X38_042049 [Prunus dulcis]|uniref:Reverse transcriptase Ty1/copia-type domain-containing protein n=1 Tax=Prunus dulcis TaxID=3755 RepID=A0AAD4UU41_PRUDU|nr:hypothetical protein L3X38_042049 [Prunus dulcis]
MDLQEEEELGGKAQTYKARLVAKDYRQREGIDYEKTLSSRNDKIHLHSSRQRIILRLEIWQMDVKTTFLNGHLQDEIYMDQPEGFIFENEQGKVCKLQGSIYGL